MTSKIVQFPEIPETDTERFEAWLDGWFAKYDMGCCFAYTREDLEWIARDAWMQRGLE